MLRIYVKSIIPDARAKARQKQFAALGLKHNPGAIRLIDCYSIDSALNPKQLNKAKQLLANPLSQTATTHYPLPTTHFSYAIEIGFLPGVTDNIGHTAKETLIDGAGVKFKPGQNVYSSQVFFVLFKKNNSAQSAKADISGQLAKADAQKIADSLHNPLIQKATIVNFDEFKKLAGTGSKIPKVKLSGSNKVAKVDLNISDEQLIKLGKLGIKSRKGYQGPLALSLHELKAIQKYFNNQHRSPTDIELETLAQTWSEHCKHTIFADPLDEIKDGIFRHYIKRATETVRKQKGRKDFCVSVFTDNAGGINFDKDYIVSYKVETHNTPSALDPFGGSITGIVGVNRDIIGFGLGAKPIANFYGFCLADPNDKTQLYRDKNLQQPMLSSRRIFDGVVAGVNAGGNQSGIPTPLGFLYFDPRFRGKPLVFAGTVGLTPKKIGQNKPWQKQAQAGDLIVMVGGRVGADGIHGATFSSEGLDPHSPATAVQIGDPITQKKFSDAIVKEALTQNLYHAITDCGAGGLSSAIGEMAESGGGCEVWLDKVPLKYPGLEPWQIWISESQERMILAVPKNKWQKFERLMKSRDVEATAIGKFTNSARCLVNYGKQTILNLDLEFLHNGRPAENLKTQKPRTKKNPKQTKFNHKISNLKSEILNLLSRLNITSTEFVSKQYDHEVQGSSVLKPLQGRGRVNTEASVIRPVLGSKKGLVMAYGLNPELSEINPYQMAASSIDAAIRAAVAAGADVDYLALLDNFCWCSPDEPKRLWQLKEAARACYDYAVLFGTPFISGKDSMHNDFKGYGADGKKIKISIPPTLLITALGVIPDVTKTVSLDAKLPGDLLYILGENHNEALVDAQKNRKLYKALFNCIQNNLIASSISINRGGTAVAIAKTLIAGGLGTEINLASQKLFSENSSQILVSVAPQNQAKFEKMIAGNYFELIGKVTKKPALIINDKNRNIINLNIAQAEKSYKQTFKDY